MRRQFSIKRCSTIYMCAAITFEGVSLSKTNVYAIMVFLRLMIIFNGAVLRGSRMPFCAFLGCRFARFPVYISLRVWVCTTGVSILVTRLRNSDALKHFKLHFGSSQHCLLLTTFAILCLFCYRMSINFRHAALRRHGMVRRECWRRELQPTSVRCLCL